MKRTSCNPTPRFLILQAHYNRCTKKALLHELERLSFCPQAWTQRPRSSSLISSIEVGFPRHLLSSQNAIFAGFPSGQTAFLYTFQAEFDPKPVMHESWPSRITSAAGPSCRPGRALLSFVSHSSLEYMARLSPSGAWRRRVESLSHQKE